MLIRRWRSADAPSLADLWEEAFVVTWGVTPSARVRDVARWEDCEILVAESRGEVVGAVVLAPAGHPQAALAEKEEVEMRMLAVASQARGQGLGGRLVHRSLEAAAEGGARALVLWTRPANRAAQRLYARIGFERTPDRDFDRSGVTMLTYRYRFE